MQVGCNNCTEPQNLVSCHLAGTATTTSTWSIGQQCPLADRFDHVITLCDKAREVCPEFGPRRVHRSMAGPGAAGDTGEAGYAAFQRAAADMDTRIRHLMPVLNTPETFARPEP